MVIKIDNGWLQGVIGNALYGERIYQALVDGLPENTDVIYAPGHIGDMVWLCAFASAYKAKHRCRLMLAIREKHLAIAKLFPQVDYVSTFDEKHITALSIYLIVYRKWRDAHFRTGFPPSALRYERPDAGRNLLSWYSLGYGRSSYGEMFSSLLGIPADSPRDKATLMPLPEERKADFADAVLLCPDALTYRGIPRGFWERLAQSLLAAGWQVYANGGSREGGLGIPGIPVLECGLVEAACIGEAMRLCIGIRSGICDLLAVTDARLLVLYPESAGGFGEDGRMSIHLSAAELGNDVKELGREEGIWNFRYVQEQENRLIGEILEICRTAGR